MPQESRYPAGDHLNSRRTTIEGSFSTGTAGAVSSQVPAAGHGFTVAKSAEGVYVVTLTDSYSKLLYANCNAPDRVANVTESVSASSTVTFTLRDLDGTPSDLDIDSATAYFQIVLQRDA